MYNLHYFCEQHINQKLVHRKLLYFLKNIGFCLEYIYFSIGPTYLGLTCKNVKKNKSWILRKKIKLRIIKPNGGCLPQKNNSDMAVPYGDCVDVFSQETTTIWHYKLIYSGFSLYVKFPLAYTTPSNKKLGKSLEDKYPLFQWKLT